MEQRERQGDGVMGKQGEKGLIPKPKVSMKSKLLKT
jgi:hypothetical protein